MDGRRSLGLNERDRKMTFWGFFWSRGMRYPLGLGDCKWYLLLSGLNWKGTVGGRYTSCWFFKCYPGLQSFGALSTLLKLVVAGPTTESLQGQLSSSFLSLFHLSSA